MARSCPSYTTRLKLEFRPSLRFPPSSFCQCPLLQIIFITAYGCVLLSEFLLLRKASSDLIIHLPCALMATANATCYFPNGEIDSYSQSCNPESKVSHCCQNVHVCLSNGLRWDVTQNHIIRSRRREISSKIPRLTPLTVTCTDAP